jgi:hypothetical protein
VSQIPASTSLNPNGIPDFNHCSGGELGNTVSTQTGTLGKAAYCDTTPKNLLVTNESNATNESYLCSCGDEEFLVGGQFGRKEAFCIGGTVIFFLFKNRPRKSINKVTFCTLDALFFVMLMLMR